ncbi:thioredoxin [Mangrovicoccus sp. HB161399]|uniref:DsbA family protein n=1 Tax=Mangrovicoccus sp. HB161399 TaxID=2720392 RepID=UPI00155392F7|nr:thioredoxin [Mangrovicoccus sp. HB161399]
MGEGATRLAVFLEPTCPFSAKAFAKLGPLLSAAGSDRLTIAIQIQSQPWHTFSPVVSRSILAASLTAGGKDAALSVMEKVFAHREEFVLADHSHGPNMALSPADILARIEELGGVALAEAFALPEATDLMKAHARYSRRRGVHGSPSFMVDGEMREDMGSGDTVEKWLADLRLA